MNYRIQIALRYIFSKKSTNAINIISYVAMGGMTLCTAAFILILSVFNGFEGLVVSLYDQFCPELLVEPKEKKVIAQADSLTLVFEELPGVASVSRVLEENGLIRYKDRQAVATLKGVDLNYAETNPLIVQSLIGLDQFELGTNEAPLAILGAGVRHELQAVPRDPGNSLAIFVPRRKGGSILNPMDEFRRTDVLMSGTFAVQEEFDNRIVFVPFEPLRRLLQYRDEATSIAISLEAGTDRNATIQALRRVLPEGLVLRNRDQQNAVLYQVLQSEKVVVYLVLTLVLIIVAFNMIGSLSMLVIEKRHDIWMLHNMGVPGHSLGRVFLLSGLLQAVISLVAGFALAGIFILLQQHLGLIPLEGNFVVEYYPMEPRWVDFPFIAGIVLGIAAIASWIPARRASASARKAQSGLPT